MKKHILGICILSLSASLMLSGCGTKAPANESTKPSNGTQEQIKITFADYGSSKMAPAKGYQDGIAYIKEKSNGRIEIDYVPDAVLGNETEMIQQLMDGTMKMATLGTSTFSKFTDKLEAFQLPFLLTDYEKEQAAFESPEGQALLASAEDLGLKIVGYMENGIRHFANNKRPINSPTDLNGLILRVVPSTMLKEAVSMLGANPTPLNYGEVYTALQNKVIDGEEINITSLYAMKHFETIKYVSEIGMYPFPALVVFNLDYWNSLSAEDQKIITDGFKQGTDNLFEKHLPEFEVIAKEACVKAGVVFNVIDNKEAFREKIAPIYETYKAKDPKIKAFIEAMVNHK
jgi:tripartite ATP-independent transporter DctP family solute receptor